MNFFNISIMEMIQKNQSLNSYKHQHESFVSNLKGSSIGCILACLIHVPIFILLLKIVQNKCKPTVSRDFLLLVLPLLLIITVFSNHNYWSIILFVTILYPLIHYNFRNDVVVVNGNSPLVDENSSNITSSIDTNAENNKTILKYSQNRSKTSSITYFKGY